MIRLSFFFEALTRGVSKKNDTGFVVRRLTAFRRPPYPSGMVRGLLGQPAWVELAIFVACMAPAVYTDIKWKRIPDACVLLAAAGLLALRLSRASLAVDQLVGAVSAFLLFLAIWLAARQRMGFGDVKLAGLVGFLVGFPGWLLAVAGASFGGIAVVLVRRAAGRSPADESVAFAPFLIVAAAGALLALPLLEVT